VYAYGFRPAENDEEPPGNEAGDWRPGLEDRTVFADKTRADAGR